jgi:leucyl aminopeptidase
VAIDFQVAKQVPDDVDAVVMGVASDRLDQYSFDRTTLEARSFEGKLGQSITLDSADGFTYVLTGLGPSDEIDAAALRRAAAVAARHASKRESLASLLAVDSEPAERPGMVRAVTEGMSLAGYRFDRYKSKPMPLSLERVVHVGVGGKRVEDAVALGVRVSEAIGLARDLVNTPGGELTPQVFAEIAVEIAERENLQITVLGPSEIAEAGLGGLLGVNRGSANPPRFVEITYEPDTPKGALALVGKGITFDSGGLSIKSGEGMMTMKNDMGGAAAVLGAFSAMTAVAPRCRVSGYLPLTDNMINGDATRPGDVLKIRNGTTVEVLNTDAEGRLVLADALSLASEAKPDAIVDLATLTGAVEVALGDRIAGLMGNDDDWVATVADAAQRGGERVWHLPLPADYRPRFDSDVADLRNIAKSKGAGTLIAGLFLQEFVTEGIPWAHLDIAGTAWWANGADGEFATGGTGWGVRTLLELAHSFTPPRSRRGR